MRKLGLSALVLAVATGIFLLFGKFESEMPSIKGKKVLMVIAPENFRDEELFETRAQLEAAGAEVKVCSSTREPAVGMLGGKAVPDFSLDQVRAADWDAIVFVGGVGAQVYFNDNRALNLAREAYRLGKKVCAICIAPMILANAGILKGRRATVWSSFANQLEDAGAVYVQQNVVVDGNIVTAPGPQAAVEFGKAIARELAG